MTVRCADPAVVGGCGQGGGPARHRESAPSVLWLRVHHRLNPSQGQLGTFPSQQGSEPEGGRSKCRTTLTSRGPRCLYLSEFLA